MKNILLISILVFTYVSDASCVERITNTLQPKHGLKYEVNDDNPFTGKYITYFYKGKERKNKKEESNFNNGKLDGSSTFWYKSGEKRQELYYKDGKLNGLYTKWYKSGQKILEINYKDHKRDGFSTHWHKNGQKKEEVNYKKGKRNGLLTKWHKNGHKRLEANYKNGKKVKIKQ